MGIKPGPSRLLNQLAKKIKKACHSENKPKHPGLKEHDHKKGNNSLLV